MAIYKVKDKQTIAPLFAGWDEGCIWSCLQDCMGVAYADDLQTPRCAAIFLGEFLFFAGDAKDELVRNKPKECTSDFVILVPGSEAWEESIERVYGTRATRIMRYATKKEEGVFREAYLQEIVSGLSPEYELRAVDEELYDKTKTMEWSRASCGNYASYETYQKYALGIAILKENEPVSIASTYTHFNHGIEIEIDTREDERRKGHAAVSGAKLILECLRRDLYPSWDALNKGSLAVAKKLGYEFAREYVSYEVADFLYTRK